MSPVGVTRERESKRLSFLHLGRARRRRNGNPSRGGQDSHSGKGRSKKTEKPKTGKKPKAGRRNLDREPAKRKIRTQKIGTKPENRTQEPGGNPKKGDTRQSLLRKQKSPLSEIAPTGVNT